ncbi:hypothetical protein N658DRAFT_25723 [Parathielavia hyrcaniae]|uniref:Uncharacterized protein n=1 Tax=Parathielavia hyrcaniae TaxID=113614 RepID=A0AAN6T785_9PEZI|nr:hypothetical protein N658DRAFT_25723 [Parathielavia hyrcaniae]
MRSVRATMPRVPARWSGISVRPQYQSEKLQPGIPRASFGHPCKEPNDALGYSLGLWLEYSQKADKLQDEFRGEQGVSRQTVLRRLVAASQISPPQASETRSRLDETVNNRTPMLTINKLVKHLERSEPRPFIIQRGTCVPALMHRPAMPLRATRIVPSGQRALCHTSSANNPEGDSTQYRPSSQRLKILASAPETV